MIYSKHLQYGLPEYFVIYTWEGQMDNWKQAIDLFNEIFDSEWVGNIRNYYGYCWNGVGTNGTDSYHENELPKNIKIFTPTEFLNIVNNKTQTLTQMKHNLQEGDTLENVTAEQWEIIKTIAPQYGVEIYSYTLGSKFPRTDYNGALTFDGKKLLGSVHTLRKLPFDQFMLAMMGKEIVKPIKIKLNNDYEAVVTKTDVTVGCQTFTHDRIKALYNAVLEMT
jgi:hypothetical protein